jgi:hypothetical protein
MVADDGGRLVQVLAGLGYLGATRGDDPEHRMGPVLAMHGQWLWIAWMSSRRRSHSCSSCANAAGKVD